MCEVMAQQTQVGAGRGAVAALPRPVPDAGRAGRRAGRRGGPLVVRARVQPPGAGPAPHRPGGGARPRRPAARRPRRPARPAGHRAVHGPGRAGLRLRGRPRGGRHQHGAGAGPLGRSPAAAPRGAGGRRRRPSRPGEAWAWNQAMLDLGATVCARRAPRCGACPVADAVRLGDSPVTRSRIPPTARRACRAASRASRAATARGGAAWSRRCARARSRAAELARGDGLARRRPSARERVAATLVADGLAPRDVDGAYRLSP